MQISTSVGVVQVMCALLLAVVGVFVSLQLNIRTDLAAREPGYSRSRCLQIRSNDLAPVSQRRVGLFLPETLVPTPPNPKLISSRHHTVSPKLGGVVARSLHLTVQPGSFPGTWPTLELPTKKIVSG